MKNATIFNINDSGQRNAVARTVTEKCSKYPKARASIHSRKNFRICYTQFMLQKTDFS